MGLTILVIGSGGREHVLTQKFVQSPMVTKVFCAKGNPGMNQRGIQTVAIEEDDHQALIAFAKEQQVDWTFVGPEVPLLNGIVDDFLAAGLRIFGPTKAAAFIEGSKDFAKQLMNRYQIPTAAHQTFTSFEAAKTYIETKEMPIVIKADGLAAGKGVVVATTQVQALEALADMLKHNKFGKSGARVVVEEFLEGEEFSLMAFVRGTEVYPMVIAQDHKRAFDGDRGPNTGGMGAYSPVPQIAETMIDQAIEKILKPAALGMQKEGRSFTGILYAGLIATAEGPKVIEFNARFGDPETQVVLQRLTSDLATIIDDLLHERTPIIQWNPTGVSLGVVVAAEGYPGTYETGHVLPNFDEEEQVNVYYAGVKKQKEQLVSEGGRVYLIEASADTLEEAQRQIYTLLAQSKTTGTFYRNDIGDKAILAQKQN